MSRIGPRDARPVGCLPRRSLADLLWLANTRHGPGGHWFARVTADDPDHDHLASAADAVRYLVDHGVHVPAGAPGPGELRALRAIRAMVRGLVDPAAGWTPDARAVLDSARLRLDPDGGLGADGAGWAAFVGDLMLPLVELVRLRTRLAVCGNPACRLIFLDASRNGTRRWCDNAGCGNRARVRRHRERVATTRDESHARDSAPVQT